MRVYDNLDHPYHGHGTNDPAPHDSRRNPCSIIIAENSGTDNNRYVDTYVVGAATCPRGCIGYSGTVDHHPPTYGHAGYANQGRHP